MPITIAQFLAQAPKLTQVFERLRLSETLRTNSWSAWVTLLACIFLGLLAGKVAQTLLKTVSRGLTNRGWGLRGTIFNNAAGPASLALFSFAFSIGLAQLQLPVEVRPLRHNASNFLFIMSLAWFLYNLVDLIDVALRHLTSKTDSKLDDQMVPLIRKTLRLFLVVVFSLFTAENIFGADITAWLTGLGIAGLAVSLAAQESIKNLFGSITIFMDRPFGVGDRVNCAGYDGHIEEIGFRSTKMRTILGNLVTIPNSKIVDGTVENISRRPYIRRVVDFALSQETTPDKLDHAVQIVNDVLAEPDIAVGFGEVEQHRPRVAFNDFGATSLNIRVIYWFASNDELAYMDHAHRFNLKVLRAFRKAKIHLVAQPAAAPAPLKTDEKPVPALAA